MKILFIIMLGMAVSLDLLDIDKHHLIYEFSFSCGNSYLMNKKIIADINNELTNSGVSFTSELAGKKNFSTTFNIYEKIGDQMILLATIDKNSNLYQDVLKNYPTVFYNNILNDRVATEEEMGARKQLIQQIIMMLNKTH